DSVRVYLYNATSLVNNTNVSGAFAYVNFTGLADGAYSVNATANDTFGNINQTSEIRRFTVDTINPLVDYGTGTAAAGANLSQTFVYVNVSLTETNEANISFALYNATSLVNLTNYTTSVRTINWTGLAANVTYTYNVTVVDLVGHTNVTATRLITFDTTKPLISFTGATDVDGANFSTRTNVYVNVSVTETNEKNITFYLYNTTVLVNSTAYITGVRTINWTGLSNNSIYTYNVTIFDYAGNSNTTSTRTITFDNVAPSIQYVNPSTADGSSPEQSYIRVNVTVSDTNYVRNISISLFNSTGGLIVSNSSASSPSSFYIEFPNLVVGIYYVNASANDSSGNINFTSSRTVSLINNTTPSSSSSGSSSGGSSAKKDFWSNTYVYDNQEFSQTGSLTRLLGKTERVRVKVDGVLHHVGVTAVNGNQVVINTSSVSQQETINIGDSAKFELTGDSYYDLLIKINSIMSGKANLTISSIHELKQVVPLVSPPINENTPEPTANPAPILESPQTSKDVSSALIWVIVLIVVLVIIGIILYKHRWKKKNPFYQFY
ncbi:MAG: hypothetical protein Q7S74_03035, partial [Nanoarchaeota archaeon]|nr:hypothetical protein [Nanoarchaeota archaeon]